MVEIQNGPEGDEALNNNEAEEINDNLEEENKKTDDSAVETEEASISEENMDDTSVTEEESKTVADEDAIEEEPEEADEPKERKLNWAKKGSSDKKEKNVLKEAEDKYQRLFAEFDNFRKRSEKEKSQRYDMGAKDVIEKILPVLDNFERGFDTVEESDKDDAFVTGMDLIYKQFMTTLEDMGVKPIEALGKEFNPDFHNAVMHVDDPEAGQNIIVEEFQKGYTYKDQVVRYSMVKVAN